MRRDEIRIIRELVCSGVGLGLTIASVYESCQATGFDVSYDYVQRLYREFERKNSQDW